ncbi:hypothetical protein DPSP01_014003 [Paraphaeosphaeria sporulosa]
MNKTRDRAVCNQCNALTTYVHVLATQIEGEKAAKESQHRRREFHLQMSARRYMAKWEEHCLRLERTIKELLEEIESKDSSITQLTQELEQAKEMECAIVLARMAD